MADKTFEFRIPVELHEQLKSAAKAQHRPLSQLVREILRSYVEGQSNG